MKGWERATNLYSALPAAQPPDNGVNVRKYLTHWPITGAALELNWLFSDSHKEQISWAFLINFFSGKYHNTSETISQRWFR